jgi:tetratricopeptide (TPR) repeat protein
VARPPDRDDPLTSVRRLLRDCRRGSGFTAGPHAGAIEVALYRLPTRQREIVKRYDLAGETRTRVQRELGLSPRQFFRDRRAALVKLSKYLFQRDDPPSDPLPLDTESYQRDIVLREALVVRRALARSLCYGGNIEGLRVLRELTEQVSEPGARAEVLLDLAQAAADYENDAIGSQALCSAAAIVDGATGIACERATYLSGRLAHLQARRCKTRADAARGYRRAILLLRRSVDADPRLMEARFALADALGDLALHHFDQGAFPAARAASSEATELIATFALSSKPKALEILAMDAVLDACISARTRAAIDTVSILLLRAIESGWCAAACRLGTYMVGLNGICGDYEEAIRWYRRMSSVFSDTARPIDRSNIAGEVAHAYTMTGRAVEALSVLNYGGATYAECEEPDAPGRHAFVAAALQRLRRDVAALHEAREALAGYTALDQARGSADAHRLIALSLARLGDKKVAREHLLEAQCLTESHGTPYALLRLLVAKADISGNAAIRAEAIEFAHLLRRLAQ